MKAQSYSLMLCIVVALLAACSSLLIPQVHAQAWPMELPTVHGMLIVGERVVFLSHLSILPESPHRFQAIFEVYLPNQTAYASDRARNPKQRIYTLEPKSFVL
jgi:hypothetical protein